jgi:hypothetical protein
LRFARTGEGERDAAGEFFEEALQALALFEAHAQVQVIADIDELEHAHTVFACGFLERRLHFAFVRKQRPRPAGARALEDDMERALGIERAKRFALACAVSTPMSQVETRE